MDEIPASTALRRNDGEFLGFVIPWRLRHETEQACLTARQGISLKIPNLTLALFEARKTNGRNVFV
jgi:hypothetical protein